MSGPVYYNEIDPAAAAILHQLIADGVIAPGFVDTRSIKEVQPDDLAGFTQCHFFAGGGLWSVAARMAGWPDDRPLWTGSCPCQPFSAAGKGLGTDDPRHLWPDFLRLISACRGRGFGPPVVMGEQVSGAAGYGWFDGVRSDLEGEGYASRAVDFPACSVDAPHQRNRLYWIAVAHAENGRHGTSDQRPPDRFSNPDGAGELVDAASQRRGEGRPEHELRGWWPTPAGADASGDVAGDQGERGETGRRSGRGRSEHAKPELRHNPGGSLDHGLGEGLEGHPGHGDRSRRPEPHRPVAPADGAGAAGVLAGAYASRFHGQRPGAAAGAAGGFEGEAHERQRLRAANRQHAHDRRNGTYWSDAEWIVCHDGKARRAKPGLRLLVDGLSGRVDLWRVGGNAIVPQAAAEVIAAFLDAEAEIIGAAA